ncbi:hypothetical protein OPV22_030832 [Ensete ventricosum]|uniref:Uncharacterized protein n=1 Tax=Ensete ventricosum TaxID=4639 RepID=A0AAV8PJW7_ENSVE|nr:hypothetical protein OPV22_030832 [Ensete ventricosum]
MPTADRAVLHAHPPVIFFFSLLGTVRRRRPEDPPDGAPPHLSFPQALAVRMARRAPRGAVPVDAAWSFLQQFARKCRSHTLPGSGAALSAASTLADNR